MKNLVKIFSLATLLSGSAKASTLPGDLESEKTKSYTKTYTIASGDKISLDNKFGEMKIGTWNRNEIKVDVNITVKAKTDERAQKIIDDISIEDGKTGSGIYFKTHFRDEDKRHDDDGDDKNVNRNRNHNSNDNDNTNMKINYTVFLPANATLDAINSFGAMSIGDFDGPVTLSSRFGSLTAGKLLQSKKVDVQFGKGTIESMNNGKLSIQFSKAQVNRLSGDITADLNQSGGVKLTLDKSIKKLDVHNEFGTLYLDADKDLSANFNIHTSFGNFSNKSGFTMNRDDDENRWVVTNRTYTGKAGSGSTPISVKSNFGNVVLGHDLKFDVNVKSDMHINLNHEEEDGGKHKDKSDKKRIRV